MSLLRPGVIKQHKPPLCLIPILYLFSRLRIHGEMAEAQASLDFSDPVFKKLSQRNGLVNKMTKDQLINTLRQLGLESR